MTKTKTLDDMPHHAKLNLALATHTLVENYFKRPGVEERYQVWLAARGEKE
jgi:hypothetical protein